MSWWFLLGSQDMEGVSIFVTRPQCPCRDVTSAAGLGLSNMQRIWSPSTPEPETLPTTEHVPTHSPNTKTSKSWHGIQRKLPNYQWSLPVSSGLIYWINLLSQPTVKRFEAKRRKKSENTASPKSSREWGQSHQNQKRVPTPSIRQLGSRPPHWGWRPCLSPEGPFMR